MIVTFEEAKMAQSHWKNNLLHLFLKHCRKVKFSGNRKNGYQITFQNYPTRVLTQELILQNLKGRSSGLKRSFAKTTNQLISQTTTETVELSRMKNKKLGVEFVTSLATQKKIVNHHATIVNNQDIVTEIVLKEVTEEEAKAEEEKKEEITHHLDKEDSHPKEEIIPHIQKEKERRKEVKTIERETIVPTNQSLIQIDQAGHNQDLNLKQNQTLLQEERNQRNMEDQIETEEDTTRKTIIATIG